MNFYLGWNIETVEITTIEAWNRSPTAMVVKVLRMQNQGVVVVVVVVVVVYQE